MPESSNAYCASNSDGGRGRTAPPLCSSTATERNSRFKHHRAQQPQALVQDDGGGEGEWYAWHCSLVMPSPRCGG